MDSLTLRNLSRAYLTAEDFLSRDDSMAKNIHRNTLTLYITIQIQSNKKMQLNKIRNKELRATKEQGGEANS